MLCQLSYSHRVKEAKSIIATCLPGVRAGEHAFCRFADAAFCITLFCTAYLLDPSRPLWDDAHAFEGRLSMPHYLHQVAYAREGWQALIAQPQDRVEAVRKSIEKLGGKIKSAYFSFGDYDVVVITEMPDNTTAAAISIAFAGGGACKAVHTTPLLAPEEALQAIKKAGESDYRAPRAA